MFYIADIVSDISGIVDKTPPVAGVYLDGMALDPRYVIGAGPRSNKFSVFNSVNDGVPNKCGQFLILGTGFNDQRSNLELSQKEKAPDGDRTP